VYLGKLVCKKHNVPSEQISFFYKCCKHLPAFHQSITLFWLGGGFHKAPNKAVVGFLGYETLMQVLTKNMTIVEGFRQKSLILPQLYYCLSRVSLVVLRLASIRNAIEYRVKRTTVICFNCTFQCEVVYLLNSVIILHYFTQRLCNCAVTSISSKALVNPCVL